MRIYISNPVLFTKFAQFIEKIFFESDMFRSFRLGRIQVHMEGIDFSVRCYSREYRALFDLMIHSRVIHSLTLMEISFLVSKIFLVTFFVFVFLVFLLRSLRDYEFQTKSESHYHAMLRCLECIFLLEVKMILDFLK